MSDIRFQCQHCSAALTVPSKLAGVTGPCPFCRANITAPNLQQPQTQIPQQAHSAPTPQTPSAPQPQQQAQQQLSQQQQAPSPPQNPWQSPKQTKPTPTSTITPRSPERPLKKPRSKSSPTNEYPAPPDVGEIKQSKGRKLIFFAATVTILLSGAAVVYFTILTPPDPAPTSAGSPPAPAPAPLPAELPQEAAPKPSIAANNPPPVSQSPEPPVATDGGTAPEAETETETESPLDTSGSNPNDEILSPPREALVKFLEARSWRERKDLVQLPETTASEMEDYYATNQDGPVAVNTITFQNSEPVPNKDTMFFLFHITTENVPEGFPVSVEETPEGYKIDWQAFVEFNDHQLYKFITEFQSGSRRFHVIMRRAHYFGPDIPDLENKFAFRI
ncbi:MAG: hypothetical protein P8J87_08315, partial [Verrucomicrobiales bacterium]|nr:hypothetical protein [Verrucomicrobiales bacterium]